MPVEISRGFHRQADVLQLVVGVLQLTAGMADRRSRLAVPSPRQSSWSAFRRLASLGQSSETSRGQLARARKPERRSGAAEETARVSVPTSRRSDRTSRRTDPTSRLSEPPSRISDSRPDKSYAPSD